MGCSSNPALPIGTCRPGPFTTLRLAVSDFWSLTKPEVNFLILIATFSGFYLGLPAGIDAPQPERLLNTLLGTLLVASGAGALNQALESRFDALMRRTSRRPIAAGRVRPITALSIGILLSIAGATYLFFAANPLASALAAFTLLSYLAVYTPLKRRTPLCTLAGAVPGAMPPLIGWAAAAGSIGDPRAWMAFLVLFLWQLPHFMAIAWMYREDYGRAGYRILPADRPQRFLACLTAVPAIALFALSAVAAPKNARGIPLYAGALMLNATLLYYAIRLILLNSRIAARVLLKATILYLPVEFLLLGLRKG